MNSPEASFDAQPGYRPVMPVQARPAVVDGHYNPYEKPYTQQPHRPAQEALPVSPNTLNASIESTYESQSENIQDMFKALGFDTRNIKEVKFGGNIDSPFGNKRGFVAGMFDKSKGLFQVTEHGTVHPEGLLATFIHENAHAASPFINLSIRNALLSSEKGIEFQELTKQMNLLAIQSIETQKFFNGYHRLLFENLSAQKIDFAHFMEETSAILMEMRYTNPKHLVIVGEQMYKHRLRTGTMDKFVNPIAVSNKQIYVMTPGLKHSDHNSIEEHIAKVKKDLRYHIAEFFEKGTNKQVEVARNFNQQEIHKREYKPIPEANVLEYAWGIEAQRVDKPKIVQKALHGELEEIIKELSDWDTFIKNLFRLLFFVNPAFPTSRKALEA